MRLTARCIFGTLLAVSSLSWITAASGEGDVVEDKGFRPCTATVTLEGPCKHEEETMCPYLFSLPPLTINLPMRLRELEQIVEDLQKLKDNVDQLRKMCADCTVSQTERECGSQTEREHEKLHEDTHEDGMILMNETKVEILKENERDSRHECGINGVKTENTVKSDDDTASEKRDSLKESERKIWESKRETNKTVVKENEKKETLREVPKKDGKTHRKVEGVKGKGKLVQTQVPAAGKNEGRVEREEVVDKNHEETETDRNKVDISKGSQEDTSEKKHPSKDRNTEKTEENDQDETKETEKKTQTEGDRTGDRIKMSVDDDEHTNKDREQNREEREKEKGVKTEQTKEKPKQTESTPLTKKDKTVKEGEDREKGKKTKTAGEKTAQGEQSSSDGDLKTTKTIERTDLFSDSLTPDSTTDLTSSPRFTDLDNAVAFTSSPSLSSSVSHFITDVDQDEKKTADGLKSKSTNFMDAGSSEYPNFDSDSGFRTTSRPASSTPTISPLEDTGQKATSATIRFTTTTSKDKGSSTKTTSITTTPRQTYTTTFSAVTDHSQWTSKKNISSNTKTGVEHTQSQGPKHSGKHKPGIKPGADQTLKHPKNDRKLVQAPLPDKKINNDQRQKPPHQKPTTDQKSTSVKSPKPVQIPKHDQKPQLHNLPIDEDQKNEEILKNDQVQPTGQNELPTQKPKSHDKALPPVQRPTSQKKPVALNTTNYKDPATEQQPISDEIITQSPSADKITIHPPKIDRPDQRKDPDKKLKSEDNAKSDGRSNEYFTPAGNTESEISPMSSVTPNPNENALNELKENDQNPSLEPNISVQVSTPEPKPTPEQTDAKLKPKPNQQIPKINQKPKPGQNITKTNLKPKPGQNITKIIQKPKPGQSITKIIQKPKPGQNITKTNLKPKPGQNITKIIQKPKPGQDITKIIQKPKPGQNITKNIQKPKPGQNITKIIQKPKPGQNITKIIQKPKPGQNITKIIQKPKPGQDITKINQKPKPGKNITTINQKPKPGQAPKDKVKTSDLDQIPEAESNTTPKRWPSPGLRPSTRPTINPGATPAPKLKPAVQLESTPKTKTDLDPTFISGVASESTPHTETGIQPTSGPIKQSTEVTHSQRGTEFSPSDRKPSPLGPKTSNTLDPDPSHHLNTLPEGFTLSPKGRIKSDRRPQTTIQPPSILWTTRPKTGISESSKSLMSSTTPGSTSLSSNTDSKTQSKVFDAVDEIESSQTTARDKTTTSVPYSSVQTTSTVSSDFRSNQYFIPIEKTESETSTSSVTPNPNENHVSEFKEKDQSPSAESNISVQDSTSGQKPTPDQTDTTLKLKPNQQIPKIKQKPKPGQNVTKIIQKPKPGQNVTKIIQKPKPGKNVTKIIQKPKPGQNVTKIIQKPKPGQVPKINQKHPTFETDQKTKLKPKPGQVPKDKFKTPDLDQIPEAESSTTSKRWPSPGHRPPTRPVFSPGATPAPKLIPTVQSGSNAKTKTDLDPTFISGVASESTHLTETGIEPTSGPIKQSTEVTHSQKGTEFSPSDRKPSPLGPKTSNTLDPDPFPHLNTVPEGFTLSPTGRTKSDLRTQTTTQSLLIPGTTRSNTIFDGTLKSLMSTTTPRSTSLASSTDSKSQSKTFEKVDEIESSWTTTRDKTTTSVPFPRVQTTSTVSSAFRSTTTPTSASKSKHTFTPMKMAESETSTSSITPNPNENHVSEFKENDHSPSAEFNISVQDSKSGQKPTPDQTDTTLKLKPNQQIPKINQKPKPGQNITKIIQKPKPGKNVTKIIQKPKPGQNVPKINQKPKPGQNITKINQKPKPGQVPKINQKHPTFETDQKTKLKPKPEQAPKDKFKTPDLDQIPEAESNKTPKRWPPPVLRPSTTPVFSPGATPAPKLKPAVQLESTVKTKTDLDPTFISGMASESTPHTETGIEPTSGPIKQSTEVTHSQRGTEFSPSDRKPSPLGPKTSNTLDSDPFPHLNTLPEGFTMSPTGRTKSDLRTQTTTQPPSILWTTRPKTVIGGTLKSLMFSTTPRSTGLSSNTDSKSQSKVFDEVDEIESSQTTTRDKTTTSVPYSNVKTTSTVSPDFRSTTTPTFASKSNQYFIPIEKTEIKTSPSSVTPNPNENAVNELSENDENPPLKPTISVQDSTSRQKPGPDRSDAKLKPKPNQQIPKINQKPKPGQNVTKIIQKPKPGQDIPKINQKPKPRQNITKIIQKPKPGQNVTKIIQKPKPGQDVPKITQKPKPGQNVTKIIQKPKPGQDVPKINQKPKPGQNITKIIPKPKPGQVPKINQKHPTLETDQKTKLRPEPEQAPKNNFETSDLDQIPEAESNTTLKQWPSPGLRPPTRPVFSPGATSAPKLKPALQSESAPKTKTDLDLTSESTYHTETGIQPTSGPIKQSTEVTHSQRGTEFNPSDRKPSPLGPKTSNTLDPDPFPHLNTLPEGFTLSPTGRTKSDRRPQTTIQPPSILWTTRPRTVIGGTHKSLMSSTTPRSTSLASNTDSKSQSVLENDKETAFGQTTTPDQTTTTSVPSPRVQTTSTVSSGVRSTTTTSGPEAPAEASTLTARELRVKINQVAAFLNNSMNPKLRPSDTTSKDHPEVDGRSSTFSTLAPKVVRDCSDHLLRGKTQSGVYLVTPDLRSRSFSVFCDMELTGGGWTVLQRRKDGSVNFNRLWDEYKEGFGDIDGGEFWLGNNLIHLLTRERDMVLRVELEDFDGVMEFAEYEHFKVASERMRFRLTVSGYSGTAGDALRFSKRYDHNNRAFTTPDRDHDRYPSGNCGAYYSSGWWFDACMAANLNGKYYSGRYKGVRDGIFWGTWHNISTEYYPTNERQSFKSVRMMIRPKGFMP